MTQDAELTQAVRMAIAEGMRLVTDRSGKRGVFIPDRVVESVISKVREASPVLAVDEAMVERLKPLLQQVGDSIAGVFEQMLKGNWRDDHGHDVRLNAQMLALQKSVAAVMDFRAAFLDYSKPALSLSQNAGGEQPAPKAGAYCNSEPGEAWAKAYADATTPAPNVVSGAVREALEPAADTGRAALSQEPSPSAREES